jgi:hypothetical protein
MESINILEKEAMVMVRSASIRLLMVMMAAMILIIAGQAYAWEENTDRPGMDYKNFDLTAADPALCENACKGDATCKAWTYVKPGIQGRAARCWLKNNVPTAKNNQCCVSGVKQLTMQVKPISPAVIDRVQIKPGPIEQVKQCPDIKAMSIDFKLVAKTSSDAGTVNVTGVAKNIGAKPNPVGGKLQLWMGTSLIGETAFTTVPAGGTVTISRQKAFSKAAVYMGDFVLKVIYDPYSGIPNKYDVDCDWNNNEIKRPIVDATSVL